MEKNHRPKEAAASRPQSAAAQVALIAIILLAFALRLYRLGYQSVWYDEGVSIHLAHKSLAALTAHTAGDIHPPLYYYLLHFWIRVAGDGEFAAAFFSLIFGIMLLPLMHRLGRRLYDSRVGLLAALLVALSPYNLWYSQEIRMYTLGALLGLVSAYCMVILLHQAAQPSPPLWPWAGYVLSVALGLYTLYYFFFLLLFQNLFVFAWWLWERKRGQKKRTLPLSWVLSQLAIFVLYLPWLPIALRQALHPPVPPWRSFTSLGDVLVESWSALSLGQSVEPGRVWPALALIGVICLVGLQRETEGNKGKDFSPYFLLAYTFVPLLIIYLLSLWKPLYHVRYVFVYSPGFYILLAAGLARIKRASTFALLASLSLIAGASAYSIYNFHFDPRYASDDHRAAVKHIQQHLRPGDAVLINAGYVYPAFLYYYHGPIAWRGRLVNYPGADSVQGEGAIVLQTGSIGGDEGLGWGNPTSDFYATTEEETAQALEQLFAQHPRLWVLRAYDTVTDPSGFIRRWLDEHGLKFDDMPVAGKSNIRVQGYRTHREPMYEAPSLAHPVGVALGERITLLGYQGELTSVEAGQAIDLTLYWQPKRQLQTNYRLFLGLFGPQGSLWAQLDEEPIGPLYPPSRWAPGEVISYPLRLEVPRGTPPCEYALQVGMYDPARGRYLEVRDEKWGVGGIQARLGTVNIERPPSLPPPWWQRLVRTDFADQVELWSYSLGQRQVVAGQSLHVDLFWRALTDIGEDYVVSLQLQDREGKAWAKQLSSPADGRYPTSRWGAGEVVWDQHDLLITAEAPEGRYRLLLGLCRPAEEECLKVKSWLFGLGDSLTLGTVSVQSRPRSFEIPTTIQHPLRARLGNAVQLLGYDLSAEGVKPGGELRLILYWQALGRMEVSYKVFTHLIDDQNGIWGQQDSVPGQGTLPTTGWVKGEVLMDGYELVVRSDAPPGEYAIEIGMYEEDMGRRLPTFDAGGQPLGDRILLGKVLVED